MAPNAASVPKGPTKGAQNNTRFCSSLPSSFPPFGVTVHIVQTAYFDTYRTPPPRFPAPPPSVPGALDTLQRTQKLLPVLLEEMEDYHRSVASHYWRTVRERDVCTPFHT